MYLVYFWFWLFGIWLLLKQHINQQIEKLICCSNKNIALSFRNLSQSSSVSCAFEISANACEIKLHLKK